MKTNHHARVGCADGSQLPLQQRELNRFLTLLFRTDELIELRMVETWTGIQSKKESRLLHRTWQSCDEIVASLPEMQKWNEVGNVFFGVNPRRDRGGTKASVDRCRVVWADLDNITLEDATGRWNGISLPPSAIVDSGHGIHAYWTLDESVSLIDAAERKAWEAIVKSFASILGGDATHDCTRLLRLPGTMNVKDRRNGASPVPCTLVSMEASRVYPRATFEQFLDPQPSSISGDRSSCDHFHVREHVQLSTVSMGRRRDHRRIQGVLRYLDRNVADRSRRDLGALILLSQAGLSKAEIHSLVMDKSKFVEAGDDYFERTFDAAMRYLER